MSDHVGIGVVGTGYIAKYHAIAAAQTEGAEVRAIVGTSEDKARAFGDAHGPQGDAGTDSAVRSYLDIDGLAADDGVDAVVLATPNVLHLPHALRLLEAKKHLLIEKPMALNAAEAEQIRAAARANDRRVLVGHMWRFDREALHLRAVIERGEIGEIVKTKGYGIHALWGPSGWFVNKSEAGGGALIDMGVHAIDTVRFLLGDPEPTSVYARIDTHHGEYDVDDAGVVVVNWSCGTVSIIESGWWNPHMDGVEASTQLFGTTGYARLFPTAITRIKDGQPDVETPTFEARAEHCDQHIYTGQMSELIAAIREGRDPVPGPEDGLTVMRICDAAYRSAAENRVIEL